MVAIQVYRINPIKVISRAFLRGHLPEDAVIVLVPEGMDDAELAHRLTCAAYFTQHPEEMRDA